MLARPPPFWCCRNIGSHFVFQVSWCRLRWLATQLNGGYSSALEETTAELRRGLRPVTYSMRRLATTQRSPTQRSLRGTAGTNTQQPAPSGTRAPSRSAPTPRVLSGDSAPRGLYAPWSALSGSTVRAAAESLSRSSLFLGTQPTLLGLLLVRVGEVQWGVTVRCTGGSRCGGLHGLRPHSHHSWRPCDFVTYGNKVHSYPKSTNIVSGLDGLGRWCSQYR